MSVKKYEEFVEQAEDLERSLTALVADDGLNAGHKRKLKDSLDKLKALKRISRRQLLSGDNSKTWDVLLRISQVVTQMLNFNAS